MKLYLVPTPVGNLGDMTYRAVEVLKGADLILAEDTRTSRVVMQHYGIDTPLQSYHIFNEHQTLQSVVDRLLSGMTIALVTDAGTPGISDPWLSVGARMCQKRHSGRDPPRCNSFCPRLGRQRIALRPLCLFGFPTPQERASNRCEPIVRRDPHDGYL